MARTKELSYTQLKKECDPAIFKFKTTKELPPFTGVIGQSRGIKALEFGVNIDIAIYPIQLNTITLTLNAKAEKQEYHAFIKFLADKDVYNQLTGKSYLDIVTQNENPEVMGKVYPFWLGYRYRNADRQGLDIEEEISKAIQRDKEELYIVHMNLIN